MHHWLVKQEPEDYSFAQFARDGRTDWTGVRNFQARNYLRAMAAGDAVLYYHSGGEKAVVGMATVSRTAFPDPTVEPDEEKGQWIAVELSAGEAFARSVTLTAIKADAALQKLPLVRHTRLSVMPVTAEEYMRILHLSAR